MRPYSLIIFDIDGVLYRLEESGKDDSIYKTRFYQEVKNNGIRFLKRKLEVIEENAKRIIEDIFRRYNGDVSIGLEKEYGIDRYEYFANVWNIDASKYLKPDIKLQIMLQKIDKRKAILTNAPEVWADNVLNVLEVKSLFDYIWTGESDIRKPNEEAYLQVTRFFNLSPREAIMVDDESKYLIPAKKLGMLTVLVGNSDESSADFTISSIYELPLLLANLEKSFEVR